MAFLSFCSFRSMKSVVSSAKVSALASCFAYLIPVMCSVKEIFMSKISTIIMKRYGDIISPWGTPCSRIILSVRCPPVSICASLFFRKVFIQVIMSGPKPSAFSVVSIKVCEIESNAFLKSIRSISADFFFFIVCLIRLIRLMMQLPMLLCLIYAFCCRPMIDSTAGLMR